MATKKTALTSSSRSKRMAGVAKRSTRSSTRSSNKSMAKKSTRKSKTATGRGVSIPAWMKKMVMGGKAKKPSGVPNTRRSSTRKGMGR